MKRGVFLTDFQFRLRAGIVITRGFSPFAAFRGEFCKKFSTHCALSDNMKALHTKQSVQSYKDDVVVLSGKY